MPTLRPEDFRHAVPQTAPVADEPLGACLDRFVSALAGYWRAMALPQDQALAWLGGDLALRGAWIEPLPVRPSGGPWRLGLRCTSADGHEVVFEGALFAGDRPVASARLHGGFSVNGIAQPVPGALRDALQAFESGAAMVEVKVGRWDALGHDAQAIRREVFVEEQRIPADLEWDGADGGCTHAVAYNRFGMPLGTGRLLEHVPGVAKIGRMAVSQALRGSRVGRSVLEALMDAAREQGFREVLLHAQMSAVPFYDRAGFAQRGPVFEEAGIQHVEMVRAL